MIDESKLEQGLRLEREGNKLISENYFCDDNDLEGCQQLANGRILIESGLNMIYEARRGQWLPLDLVKRLRVKIEEEEQ